MQVSVSSLIGVPAPFARPVRKKRNKVPIENFEKPASKRLMENVHMQGFRNPEE
jgi:hypothetical protein